MAFASPLTKPRGAPKSMRSIRKSGKLLGWGHLNEFCTDPESNLAKVASEYKGVKVFRVMEEENVLNDVFFRKLVHDTRALPGVSLHGSLPCTPSA